MYHGSLPIGHSCSGISNQKRLHLRCSIHASVCQFNNPDMPLPSKAVASETIIKQPDASQDLSANNKEVICFKARQMQWYYLLLLII